MSPILATAIMESIDVFLTGDKDFLVVDIEIPRNFNDERIFRKILNTR